MNCLRLISTAPKFGLSAPDDAAEKNVLRLLNAKEYLLSHSSSLGIALLWALILMAAHNKLLAQHELLTLKQLDEVFQEPIQSDELEGELQRQLSPEEQSRQPVFVQEDAFTNGARAIVDIPGQRPLGLGGPASDRAPLKSLFFWSPQQALKGQPGNFAISGAEVELGYPISIDSNGIWLALGGVQRLDVSTSAVLPDSGLPVPNQLWDIEAGVMHIHDLGDDKQAGGMLRVGSPSDQPFGAWRDMTVTFLGFMTIPSGERDAWSFSLFYSPTGQIIYPIPGIAYVWRPSERLQANLGIPFSLELKPTDSLMLTASYMPLNNVQVLLRQSLGESWSIYGGYRTLNETFLLADRENNRERTYLFDQRLTLGGQRDLGRGWSLDVSAARLFDRQFFQAEKFSGRRRDELSIDSGVAITLQLVWTR